MSSHLSELGNIAVLRDRGGGVGVQSLIAILQSLEMVLKLIEKN